MKLLETIFTVIQTVFWGIVAIGAFILFGTFFAVSNWMERNI